MSVNLILTLVAAVLAVLAVVVAGRAWWLYRGARVVECPENHASAGVAVDAGRAALSSLYRRPELRLESCSRWPERGGCGQECLRQIAAAPGDCLVRNMLVEWSSDKGCALCARPFHAADWTLHEPALMAPDGSLAQWGSIPAQQIPSVLQSHRPVCWPCYVANTFVANHPDIVVDRTGLR